MKMIVRGANDTLCADLMIVHRQGRCKHPVHVIDIDGGGANIDV